MRPRPSGAAAPRRASIPGLVARLFDADDPLLLQFGAAGESLLARVRLGNCLLLLLPALLRLATARPERVDLAGLGILLAAIAGAAGFYLRARRGAPYGPRVGLLSSAFDVTGITVALAAIALFDSPLRALNAKPTFELYYVAIVTAALRLDPRIVLATALLAAAEYGALLGISATRTDLYLEVLRRPTLGAFAPIDQGLRLGLLLLTGGALALLLQHIRRLLTAAHRDRLTGLGNRQGFEASAPLLLTATRAAGRPCTVAVLDLDRFRRINDLHGHAVGDGVLRAAAGAITTHLRPGELAARWGGEEFVLVLPGHDATAATSRLERLRAELARTPLGLPGNRPPRRITASIGLASAPEDGTEAGELFRHADVRMLAAKGRGGDQVVAALTPEEFEDEVTRRRRHTPLGVARS